MQKKALLLILNFFIFMAAAQAQTGEPEMADVLRSNGKIYVVVLVLATIFAGIVAMLVRMDRKISKLENNK